MTLPPVEDPAPFVAAARGALGATPGCFRMAGEVSSTLDAGILGKDAARHHFEGELADGVWRVFRATEVLDDNPSVAMNFGEGEVEVPFLPPILGRFPGDDGDERGILDGVLQLLQRDTETTYVLPDPDGARYHLVRTLDSRGGLRGRRENVADVWFTPDLRPVEWHVTTEVPVHQSGFTLRDVDVELRLDAAGLPRDERLAAVGAWGPFHLRVDRTITYAHLGSCG